MTELIPGLAPAPEPTGVPGKDKGVVRLGDRIFGGTAAASGIFVILLVAAVAAFLLKHWPRPRTAPGAPRSPSSSSSAS